MRGVKIKYQFVSALSTPSELELSAKPVKAPIVISWPGTVPESRAFFKESYVFIKKLSVVLAYPGF